MFNSVKITLVNDTAIKVNLKLLPIIEVNHNHKE